MPPKDPFFHELETESLFAPEQKKSTPPPVVHREPPKRGGNSEVGKRPHRPHPPKSPRPHGTPKSQTKNEKKPFLPPHIALSRSTMNEAGTVVILYLADTETRSIMLAPRIESRGFLLPHEVRHGHKFLLSVCRASYEETLRDVPDIEKKDLEKIIKNDVEKAMKEEFGRAPLVIPLIEFL